MQRNFRNLITWKELQYPRLLPHFLPPLRFLAMKIVDRIPGLNKIKISSTDMKEKFGIFGESSVIGAILGVVIGIISGIGSAGVIQLAIKLAAILIILPAMLQFVADGILPITENLSNFMKEKFKGRKLNIRSRPGHAALGPICDVVGCDYVPDFDFHLRIFTGE